MSNEGHKYDVNSYKHFFDYIHERNHVEKIQKTLKLNHEEFNLVSNGHSKFKSLETYFSYDLECLCVTQGLGSEPAGGSSHALSTE